MKQVQFILKRIPAEFLVFLLRVRVIFFAGDLHYIRVIEVLGNVLAKLVFFGRVVLLLLGLARLGRGVNLPL